MKTKLEKVVDELQSMGSHVVLNRDITPRDKVVYMSWIRDIRKIVNGYIEYQKRKYIEKSEK